MSCIRIRALASATARICRIVAVGACVSLPSQAAASTYWVSPTGAAAWAACSGETPLNGTVACSLATANESLQPGDTVFLRGGIYDSPITPTRSGSGPNARIAYRGYADEVVVIKNTTTTFATYLSRYPHLGTELYLGG